jgi:hypothetical protein
VEELIADIDRQKRRIKELKCKTTHSCVSVETFERVKPHSHDGASDCRE